MEYYLPPELLLIGYRHRADSKQPEKKLFSRKQEEKKHVLDAFFLHFRRPNGRKKLYCLMEYDFTVDGGGQVSRTNTLLMHRYAQKVIFRSHLCGEAQDSGRTQTRFFAQERNERP